VKNSVIKKASNVLIVFALLLCSSIVKAQSCAMTINNNLSCDVQVDIIYYQIPGCSPCGGGVVNVTILANSSTNILCSSGALWNCGNTICDIGVTFTSPFTSTGYLYSNGQQALTTNNCNPSANTNISFTSSTIDINP